MFSYDMPDSDGVDEKKRSTLRRFATVGAAAPFAGFTERASADAGESEVRNAILGYLSTTPGAHFSKVRDDLQLGTGETQHHLRRLEEVDAIERYADGDYKRFVPAREFDAFEKAALGYLRRETPRGMLVALLRNPSASPSTLASDLEVSAPTVSKYAGELEESGLLSRADGYRLERPETVLILLVRYAESFDEEAVELAGVADELLRYDGFDTP